LNARAPSAAVVALRDFLIEMARIGRERRRKRRSQPVQPDRGLHRERRAKANHFGKLLGRSHQLFRRHHLVDDRLLQAFLGGQTAIAKREIGGRSARQCTVHLVRRA
jgi:hypothetical protein